MSQNLEAFLFVKGAWGVDLPLASRSSLCGCGTCLLQAQALRQKCGSWHVLRQSWYLERCFIHRAAGFHDALLQFI
jgi:hypothetical protein